jgi:hypothetical protein
MACLNSLESLLNPLDQAMRDLIYLNFLLLPDAQANKQK